MDVSTLRLAFHRPRSRADRSDLFLRHDPARVCERDPSLGYELLKRMAPVMIKRMQAARQRMLAIHTGAEVLKPMVLESPFMDQELDTAEDS